MKPSDNPLRADINVGPFTSPLVLNTSYAVQFVGHLETISSQDAIIASVEDKWRWMLITAFAPIAWGSTYFVTREFLPADAPLWGAAIRAIPAGLILLAIARKLPRGSWWWKSLVLGLLNVGAFFVLIYLAAQLLPTSIASTIMALAPIMMMLLAWLLAGERPRLAAFLAGMLGIVGVVAIVAAPVNNISRLGILCSVAAMAMSSLGFILTKRWKAGEMIVATTAWQLLAGGTMALLAAVAFEGEPPAFSASAALSFGYISLIATALAFTAWFAGLARLGVSTVGLVGLLNPVTGVLLGTLLGREQLTVIQALGVALVLVAIYLGQRTRTSAGITKRKLSGQPRPAYGGS